MNSNNANKQYPNIFKIPPNPLHEETTTGEISTSKSKIETESIPMNSNNANKPRDLKRNPDSEEDNEEDNEGKSNNNNTTQERYIDDQQKRNYYAFKYGADYGDTEKVTLTPELEKRYYEPMIKVTGMDWRNKDKSGKLVPDIDTDMEGVPTLSSDPVDMTCVPALSSEQIPNIFSGSNNIEQSESEHLQQYDPNKDISLSPELMDKLLSESSGSFGVNFIKVNEEETN